jgi:eukaryotic-like serine/threonine-protein kinase
MQTPGPEVVVAAPTSQTPAIIPKGLRSFDARDADFFLELLPGPRDREGVPESIRFWKNRIEETDGDNTFAVGLIYGPSGCGKSSLVKAGLLPRLSADVLTVYVEATAGETETRLLNGLRKRSLFTLPKAGLKETVASLRRGEGLPPGKKVLIVLDQFEQWLHANKQFSNSELLRALRHCDGARVQCLILVRDDFWLAVCRFMRDLEVDLVPGRNVALVDLFDLDHAHKVLAAFGRAFGKLPEMPGRDSGHDHKEFVQQAVAGLALEDVVIPVRLALFAEMMKNRAWTPAALKAVGGAQGVGVTFLEETFSAAGANPRHRLHQKAARAVLKALLPETGTNIKGNMRSKTELLKRSGYQGRPDDFNDLLRVLDQDTRLITPTDPEGGDAESEGPVDQGEEYYQLTHDYLVRSLREWLTKKQKETRSGRAELLLSERAALWSGTGERRHLPSLDEWARIRTFSSSRNWTPLQRRMVRSADRYYLRLGLALFLVLALVGWGSWTYLERLQARSEVDRLLSADVLEVPSVVKSLVARRDQVDPLLREKLLEETDPRRRLFLRLALVQWDPTQSELLMDQLLQAAAQDFSVIRKLIAPARTIVVPRLWTVWEQPGDARRRFRAVCCLADFTPEDPRWQAAGPFVVGELMAENPLTLKYWLDALQPIGTHLLPALGSALADDQWTASERRTLLELYRALATQAATPLQPLEDRLQAKLAESGVKQSRAAAHLAAVIAALGRPERVWPMLAQAPDPTLRSFLIEGLAGIGLDSQLVKQRLSVESDPGIRRALVLLLGTMPHVAPEVEQELLKLYETDPDPGIHFAARWALGRAGEHPHVQALDRRLTTGKVIGNRRWYLSTQGPSFSLIPRPVAPAAAKTNGALSMGLMAVASTEVTVEQFRLFASTHPAVAEETSQALAKLPVVKVTWHDAAAYCNWLSDKDGLPRFYELTDQLYTFPKDGVRDSERIGYRLPTEEEWESACRAGSTSSCSFGEPVAELASHYAWWYDNSRLVGGRSAVGRLKPNDCGLFDMHGNVGEWCLQVSRRRQIEVSGDTIGVARGENMQVQLSNLFSDARSYELMPQKSHRKWIGFRVVRTVK